jgi:hypothetical protein
LTASRKSSKSAEELTATFEAVVPLNGFPSIESTSKNQIRGVDDDDCCALNDMFLMVFFNEKMSFLKVYFFL